MQIAFMKSEEAMGKEADDATMSTGLSSDRGSDSASERRTIDKERKCQLQHQQVHGRHQTY